MKKAENVILAAGTLAALCTVYEAGIRMFCSFAFERKPIINLSVGDNPAEQAPQVVAGKHWLHENDHDVRSRKSADGLTLVSHYFPAEHAKATLIEFHGWRGGWDFEFSASSPLLHDLGYNLLLVEQRGQRGSEGKYLTLGLKERLDVPDWVNWYQQEYDSEIPIFITGLSMGGATVMMAADADFPPQVKGILEDCGYTDAYEIVRHVGTTMFHVPAHPACESINRFARRKLGVDLKECNAIDAVSHTKVPMMFIHGTKDHFVPCRNSIDAYHACASEKELYLAEGAGHGAAFLKDPDEYMRRITAFMERHLKD